METAPNWNAVRSNEISISGKTAVANGNRVGVAVTQKKTPSLNPGSLRQTAIRGVRGEPPSCNTQGTNVAFQDWFPAGNR